MPAEVMVCYHFADLYGLLAEKIRYAALTPKGLYHDISCTTICRGISKQLFKGP